MTSFELIYVDTKMVVFCEVWPLPADGVGCVFCDRPAESAAHLFLSYPYFFPVWYQVTR